MPKKIPSYISQLELYNFKNHQNLENYNIIFYGIFLGLESFLMVNAVMGKIFKINNPIETQIY